MYKSKDIIDSIKSLFPALTITATRSTKFSLSRLPLMLVDCNCQGKTLLTNNSWKEDYNITFSVGQASIDETDDEETKTLTSSIWETLEKNGFPGLNDAQPRDLTFSPIEPEDFQDATVWTFEIAFFSTHAQAT